MRISRVFVDLNLKVGKTIELPEWAAEHLVRVLRVPVGGKLICFNGDGFDYHGQIAKAEKKYVSAELVSRHEVSTAPRIKITLAQAIAKGEKMDWILQKSVELGVSRMVPIVTERTEVRLDAEREDRRIHHWQRVIQSACEQSGRAELPSLDAPIALNLFAANAASSACNKLVLSPSGRISINKVELNNEFVVVIGPEGGLSDREIALLEQAGFIAISLGARVLRTETAGSAILSALHTKFGDFDFN